MSENILFQIYLVSQHAVYEQFDAQSKTFSAAHTLTVCVTLKQLVSTCVASSPNSSSYEDPLVTRTSRFSEHGSVSR